MAKFCGKCGAPIDEVTGLCTKCDTESTVRVTNRQAQPQVPAQSIPEPPVQTPGNTETESENLNSKKNRSKGLKVTVTVLLSVCLFITAILALVAFDIRNSVKKDNIEIILDKVSATDIAYNAGVAPEAGLSPFYRKLNEKYEMGIDDDGLDDFVEDSSVKEFISEKVGDFCEEFFTGEAELVINKKEVTKLISNNRSVVRKEFQTDLSEEAIEEIAEMTFKGKRTVLLSNEKIKEVSPALYSLLTVGLSYVLIAVLVLLSVLIIFLMLRNSLCQALCGAGVVFTVIGALFSLPAMLYAWASSLWDVIMPNALIGGVVGGFVEVNVLISVTFLVTGILALVARLLIKKYGEDR